jgi:hypothetical protein
MIWGEVSHWLTAKIEHKQEMERMQAQEQFAAAQHARNQDAIRLQSELGVKTIQVQADADLSRLDVGAWAQAVADVGKTTGIRWLDAWNGSIRPSVATWSIVMMTLAEIGVYTMSENAWSIASAALGIYLADRTLFKRGK